MILGEEHSWIQQIKNAQENIHPWLTPISGISEPHQSELHQLPTDLPVAKDGRKTSSLHQSPIFCFHASVKLICSTLEIIFQARLANIQDIIDIYK